MSVLDAQLLLIHIDSTGSKMKIAVIGAGNIGGTIGAKWASQNHEVYFGVRDPQK